MYHVLLRSNGLIPSGLKLLLGIICNVQGHIFSKSYVYALPKIMFTYSGLVHTHSNASELKKD